MKTFSVNKKYGLTSLVQWCSNKIKLELKVSLVKLSHQPEVKLYIFRYSLIPVTNISALQLNW